MKVGHVRAMGALLQEARGKLPPVVERFVLLML